MRIRILSVLFVLSSIGCVKLGRDDYLTWNFGLEPAGPDIRIKVIRGDPFFRLVSVEGRLNGRDFEIEELALQRDTNFPLFFVEKPDFGSVRHEKSGLLDRVYISGGDASGVFEISYIFFEGRLVERSVNGRDLVDPIISKF